MWPRDEIHPDFVFLRGETYFPVEWLPNYGLLLLFGDLRCWAGPTSRTWKPRHWTFHELRPDWPVDRIHPVPSRPHPYGLYSW